MLKKLVYGVLVASVLSACGAVGTAAPSFDENDALSQERRENLRLSSATPRAEVFYQRGKLAQGGSKDYAVNLKAGQQYGIYSDCKENACKNLDMDLLFGGKVIESDTEADTYPLFTFTPSTSGKYTIRPKMVACTASQCEYHVHVVEEVAK
ncbi:hypothetical protein [Wielerella bovis]|uniref:hypothetical protein n=1 Tax=Wielerella bovis TaxID=2917790 RepID=UPI0020193B8E|nr:hypothetical protein [Wielerella bovis]MCG7656086.1 hypothetical protein [Wielerella bovis]MCG7658312.1 hypothetical protein [Wielerella bovis]